ncbi:MAG: type IV pilus modification protein PilV [Burkholderiales bacterium]|jgi:type IV pilus assembly protein PilV|nr:type IV pilus modification protein PilV [Burkholderiales bacterium]
MAADKHFPLPRSRRPQSGVVLIEVLVSLLVFLLGVLGVVALQARAVQFSVQSEDRSRAALLANDLVSQMWAEQSTSLSSAKLDAWNDQLTDTKHGLPGASVKVGEADSNGVVTIILKWKSVGATNADAASNQYVTQVVIP